MSIVQCKFAIERTFLNTFITTMEEVGAAIREVIKFYTIRGKFSSVHPDLAAEGITRIEVGAYLIFVASISSGASVKKITERNFLTINAKRTPESVTLYTVCNFTHYV